MFNRKVFGLMFALFVTAFSFAARAQHAIVDCRVIRIQEEKEVSVSGSAQKSCLKSQANQSANGEIPIYWSVENFWGSKKKVRFGSLDIQLDFANKQISKYEAQAGHPLSRPFRSEHPKRMAKPLFTKFSDKSFELMQDFQISDGEKTEFNGRMSMRCEVHFLRAGTSCPEDAKSLETPAPAHTAPEKRESAFPTAGTN